MTSHKPSFMSYEEMGTNKVSKETVEASQQASASAMAMWLKTGAVPIDYIRQRLGDPAQVVIVQPATPAQRP